MDPLNERLANLGQAVAQVGGPDKEAIADARRRWARSSRSAPRRRWAFVAAPAFAIAVALIVFFLARRSAEEQALTYAIGDAKGERGEWISAREPVHLSFSDGSRIAVARDTKMRVTAMDHRGSTIDVDQGALHADVTHRSASSWRFRTGPYTVVVKGTRFDAAWDSRQERFTLDMAEGKVEVTGPLIPAPVTVTAGQSIVADVREKRIEIRSARTADASDARKSDGDINAHSPPPSAPARDASATDKPSVSAPPNTRSNSSQAAQQPAAITRAQEEQRKPPKSAGSAATIADDTRRPSRNGAQATGLAASTSAPTEKWRQYLAARAYGAAIAAAEQRGFDAVLEDATSAELYALSDAARYAGQLGRARDALITLRARFGEQGKTAFLLGRVAADQGDASVAIEWFDRYLREQPGGPLAETATGRLIELYQPRDAGRARKLAERYLAAYPDGSYAALARTLAGK